MNSNIEFDNRATFDEDDFIGNDENDRKNDLGQEQIINSLIDEFKENRDALKVLIKDLEKLKEKIDSIFPQNLDARYMKFFEDKIKAATQLFGGILEIRKEIGKCLKIEIELRKEYSSEGNNKETDISSDEIRILANKIEKFKDIKNKKIKKLKEEIEEK